MKQVIANEGDQSQGDNDAAASQIDLIRVVRETATNENSIDSQASDQKTAESKSPAIDDLSLDSEENDEKSHDKRLVDSLILIMWSLQKSCFPTLIKIYDKRINK